MRGEFVLKLKPRFAWHHFQPLTSQSLDFHPSNPSTPSFSLSIIVDYIIATYVLELT